MPRPSLERQARKEAHGGDRAPDDEERLEHVGCDVRDVGDCLTRGHRDVVGASLGEPFGEQGENCGEPQEGREEGYPNVEPVRVGATGARGRERLFGVALTALGGVHHERRREEEEEPWRAILFCYGGRAIFVFKYASGREERREARDVIHKHSTTWIRSHGLYLQKS